MAPVTRDPLLLLFHDNGEVPFSKAVGAACQYMHLVRRTICYVLASNEIFVFKALFVERWRPASRVKIALPSTIGVVYPDCHQGLRRLSWSSDFCISVHQLTRS